MFFKLRLGFWDKFIFANPWIFVKFHNDCVKHSFEDCQPLTQRRRKGGLGAYRLGQFALGVEQVHNVIF